jgi:hypothetical protein
MSNKRNHILNQIQEIDNEIKEVKQHIEYAASEEWQHKLMLIDLEVLREKRKRYVDLLEDN